MFLNFSTNQMPRNVYLCSICKQPKKGHTCPGAPRVEVNAVFKQVFESRQSLKAKFASHDRLVVVSECTQDMPEAELDHCMEASQEEDVEDDEFVRESHVEATSGRMPEHDQMTSTRSCDRVPENAYYAPVLNMLCTGISVAEHENNVSLEAEGDWRQDMHDAVLLVLDELHAQHAVVTT